MPARDPDMRRLVSSIGGHSRAARATDREELTKPARAKSPTQLEYWIVQLDQGQPQADLIAAAKSAQSAVMKRMNLRKQQIREEARKEAEKLAAKLRGDDAA